MKKKLSHCPRIINPEKGKGNRYWAVSLYGGDFYIHYAGNSEYLANQYAVDHESIGVHVMDRRPFEVVRAACCTAGRGMESNN